MALLCRRSGLARDAAAAAAGPDPCYFGPPFAYGQNITRFAAGPVLVAIILFMCVHASGGAPAHRARAAACLRWPAVPRDAAVERDARGAVCKPTWMT